MNKKVMVLLLIVLVLLVACESKTTGKRVAIPEKSEKAPAPITGGVVADTSDNTETGQTAAEALKDLQSQETVTTVSDDSKTGNFYPAITSDAKGEGN